MKKETGRKIFRMCNFIAIALIVSYYQQYFIFRKVSIEIENTIPTWFYFGFAILFFILGVIFRIRSK